jgi:hypothetical protein
MQLHPQTSGTTKRQIKIKQPENSETANDPFSHSLYPTPFWPLEGRRCRQPQLWLQQKNGQHAKRKVNTPGSNKRGQDCWLHNVMNHRRKATSQDNKSYICSCSNCGIRSFPQSVQAHTRTIHYSSPHLVGPSNSTEHYFTSFQR